MSSGSCFSSVSAPTVLPLDVGSCSLFHKSLSVVLSLCIAATRGEVHYIQFYRSISLSIQCSPGSAPFTLHHFLEIFPFHTEFHQFVIPFSTVVFHHQHIPQFVQPLPNWRAFLHFPIFCHHKEKSAYICNWFISGRDHRCYKTYMTFMPMVSYLTTERKVMYFLNSQEPGLVVVVI